MLKIILSKNVSDLFVVYRCSHENIMNNYKLYKTKVLSVQLGKTLSFVKCEVERGGWVKLWIVVH